MKWTVGDANGFNANYIYDEYDVSVAMVYDLCQNATLEEMKEYESCQEGLKRAYMIAAAPELLAALEALTDLHDDSCRLDKYLAACAAIKKARGE